MLGYLLSSLLCQFQFRLQVSDVDWIGDLLKPFVQLNQFSFKSPNLHLSASFDCATAEHANICLALVINTYVVVVLPVCVGTSARSEAAGRRVSLLSIKTHIMIALRVVSAILAVFDDLKHLIHYPESLIEVMRRRHIVLDLSEKLRIDSSVRLPDGLSQHVLVQQNVSIFLRGAQLKSVKAKKNENLPVACLVCL